MKLLYRGPAAALAACSIALAASSTTTAVIDAGLYLNDIKFLASPEMKGRATGSPELKKAAVFIEGRFKEFGLKPAGSSYLQPFPVTMDGVLGKGNQFHFTESGRAVSLHFPEEFIPINFSSAGKLAGHVVFAGYGITAPEYKYDDYAGIDAKGKIVLVLRHEPQENDANSVFDGKSQTRHAEFAAKATNAKLHGAIGVIMIQDLVHHPGDADNMEKFGGAAGANNARIPFVQVKAARVSKWFADAGRNLDQIEAAIDSTLQPQSFAIPDSVTVDAAIDVVRPIKPAANVVGYLKGETDEYVIVGAHYDHLGLGGQYSLAPSQTGTVHPGADDNASGTAGVIELARWFSRQPPQKRGILFMTFAGEEMGLLGSAWYAEHPALPLEKAVAMINLDMVGRLREGKIYVGGADSGSGLRALLDPLIGKSGLKVDYSGGPSAGSSDHTSFTAKQVPALFFFSGLHADYHKPSDTWDKIDAPGAAKLLGLVADVAQALRDTTVRPAFIKVAPMAPGGHGGDTGAGPVSGYGPSFGSVPEFGEGVVGVKFADVRANSPAALAGFKAGDILVEFDGKPIGNLEDFTYVLRGKKPGDQVIVKVLRNGTPVTANVTLTRRD